MCDVVVVGAGAGGLCCAGELVTAGAKVALVSEMPEVAWNFRPQMVNGNRGFVQHPCWQVAWGGGWWYPVARALNVEVQFEIGPPVDLLIKGSGQGAKPLGLCLSAKGLTDVLPVVEFDPSRRHP